MKNQDRVLFFLGLLILVVVSYSVSIFAILPLARYNLWFPNQHLAALSYALLIILCINGKEAPRILYAWTLTIILLTMGSAV